MQPPNLQMRCSPLSSLLGGLCQLDSERGLYGLKTARLAKLYADVLYKDPQSEFHRRLRSYNDPVTNPSPVSAVLHA